MTRFSLTIRHLFLCLALTGVLACATSRAEVKLPSIIADHMVLQQGRAVPIWGWAEPGEAVQVSFAGNSQSAVAGADGRWQVEFAAMAASDQGRDMTIAGKNSVTLHDVLVGEVWIASGQSNMQFDIRGAINGADEIKNAKYPSVRLFKMPNTIADKPVDDLGGSWKLASPESVPPFSAIGYLFGRDLNQAIHVPVGVIEAAWGATIIETWMPIDVLQKDKDFDAFMHPGAEHDQTVAALNIYWKQEVAKAAAEGRKPPEKFRDPNRPSLLWNGMIHSMLPYALRGVTWYQGESNRERGEQYRRLLPEMIDAWRTGFKSPDMEFLIVQLANYDKPVDQPGDSRWAEVREAEAMAAVKPHNGMMTAIDLGNADEPMNIHPRNKQEVARRLCLIAMKQCYGQDIEMAGPTYNSMQIEGAQVTLHFTHADGLHVKGDGPLKGFAIAGSDKKWVWADAKIQGQDVIVSSSNVTKPVAVRYDWADNPQGNLYNTAEFPAFPFRTDNWPGISTGKIK